MCWCLYIVNKSQSSAGSASPQSPAAAVIDAPVSVLAIASEGLGPLTAFVVCVCEVYVLGCAVVRHALLFCDVLEYWIPFVFFFLHSHVRGLRTPQIGAGISYEHLKRHRSTQQSCATQSFEV